jgi:hypothetical protein
MMLNSFAKDWARWSPAERLVARLFIGGAFASACGQLLLHLA